MLLQRDGDPDGDPVSHERQEILKDIKEVVASSQSTRCVDQDSDAGNEPTRQAGNVSPHDLDAEGCGICAGDVVRDEAERDNDAKELAEATETSVARHDERSRGDVIGILPFGVGDGAGSQTDAHEIRKGDCKPNARQGHGESFPFLGGWWVVDEVVRCSWSPSNGR